MKSAQLSSLACRICGQHTSYQFLTRGDRSCQSIKVYFCRDCNAYYTEQSAFDYDNQNDGIIQYYEAHVEYIKWRQNKIFDYIKDVFNLTGGHFIDIGSGAGYSLDVALKRGWYAQGIEPCSSLAEFSKRRSDLNVIHGYYTPELAAKLNVVNPSGFDYLLIDNVLEHIDDPAGFLKTALRLLSPSGIALVAIPPVDWLRVILGRSSIVRSRFRSAQINLFYDTEQHVNYFSREAMRRLIEKRLGYVLLPNHFHHSCLLNNIVARFCSFESGYFFIRCSKRKNN